MKTGWTRSEKTKTKKDVVEGFKVNLIVQAFVKGKWRVYLLAKGTPYWLAAPPVASLSLAIGYLEMGKEWLLVLSLILVLADLLLLLFFRDPEREIGSGIVSPADGRITMIERKGTMCSVSIFMNVHNVHVNRAPADGTVLSMERIHGRFEPAFSEEADSNERVRTKLRTDRGTFEITQIAGAMARRIVPYTEVGSLVKKGQRIGMIRFGSRVDLSFTLPSGAALMVSEGQKVKAGTTTLVDRLTGRGRS